MQPDRDSIRLLRQLVDAGGKAAPRGQRLVSLGHGGVDAALGGGLARGQLHEVFADSSRDAASGAGFATILAQRLGGAAIWLREEQAERRLRLHGPGVAALGLDPGRLLFGVLPDADAVLRAGADVLRCSQLGVAVIELWRNPRNLGLTATRRFQLAAETSGVTALLLRIEAEPTPSAAATRWGVRSVASRPLEANAPGHPAFQLELLRRRGGGRGAWRLEWDHDDSTFADIGAAALSGAVVPVPADRPAADILHWRKAG